MRPERAGLGLTIALHALLVLGLLSYAPARQALLAAAPIMVDLITPPEPLKVEQPKPLPPMELPKPKPMAKKPVERPAAPELVAAPAAAPSPVSVPPPAPAPAPLGPADAGGGGSGTLTQPIFNADYLDNPAPVYPAIARRQGEQGRVILRVLVNVGGSADEVQVRTSSGFARLDEAARDTVRRWRFVSARRGTEPVAAWVLIPISFRLEG